MEIQPASYASEQPTLYAQGAKKKDILQWRTFSKGARVYFEHGKVGGKLQTTWYDATAVNEGKANFRDPVAQAKFESESAWKKKIKEGYFVDVDEAKTADVIRPMKGHPFHKQGHKLRMPCDMQRKYNGYRCLAICREPGEVQLMSSGGETFDLPHIRLACAAIMQPGDMLDGELYIHGVSLQKIGSLIKDSRPESVALKFYLYDMPQKAGKVTEWQLRKLDLAKFYQDHVAKERKIDLALGHIGDGPLVLAETRRANVESDITEFEVESVVNGFEGVILRNLHGVYRFNYRSYDVFKRKNFKDSEFTVIDMRGRKYVNPSTGVAVDIVDVCVCETNIEQKTFEVVPRGEVDVKAEYWKNKDRYIGTKLIVRYLELSDDGIPQGNPVGIAFRLEEDINDELDEEEADIWN